MHLNNHLDHIKERMAAACSMLSISKVPSREYLERMEEDLAESTNQLERWMNATGEVLEAEKKYEKARQEPKRAESEAREIQNRLQNWLKERG